MRTATIAWTSPGAKSSRPVSGGGMRGPGCMIGALVCMTGCELYKCYVKHFAPPPI